MNHHERDSERKGGRENEIRMRGWERGEGEDGVGEAEAADSALYNSDELFRYHLSHDRNSSGNVHSLRIYMSCRQTHVTSNTRG